MAACEPRRAGSRERSVSLPCCGPRKRSAQKGRKGRHLGVVAPLHAVDQASCDGDDVLERAAERHPDHVLAHGNAELFRLEQLLPLLGDVNVAAPDRRLGKRVLRDLVGDVGAREGGALDPEPLADDLAEDVDLAVLDVDALDERDAVRALGDLALELLARLGDELLRVRGRALASAGGVPARSRVRPPDAATHLVGDDKDEGVGALDGLCQVRLGDDVVPQVDPGEVLDVLVLVVDHLGELAALELRSVQSSSQCASTGRG